MYLVNEIEWQASRIEYVLVIIAVVEADDDGTGITAVNEWILSQFSVSTAQYTGY